MSKDDNYSRQYKYRRLSTTDAETASSLIANDSNDELEGTGLQSRELNKRNRQQNKSNSSTSSTPEKDIIHVDKPIVAGESLASISLKYRVTIAELKRVNKIQKDTEFYALSSVKIPVRTNSALLDILNDEMQSGTSDFSKAATATVEPFNEKYIETAKSLLAKREARSLVNEEEGDDLIGDDRVTRHVRFHSSTQDKMMWACSGADWDLSWWRVLLIGVFILVVVPFMCYYLYKHGNIHHNNKHS